MFHEENLFSFKSEAGFGWGWRDAKVKEGKQCSIWNWQ